MVCGQSYKIYWEDIAMIELILLGEENEASSSNHFNSPNFWNNSKFFKVFKDGRGIGLYKFQWNRKSDAKLKLLKYFSKLTLTNYYWMFLVSFWWLKRITPCWCWWWGEIVCRMIIVWYHVENCSATGDRHPYHCCLAFASIGAIKRPKGYKKTKRLQKDQNRPKGQ